MRLRLRDGHFVLVHMGARVGSFQAVRCGELAHSLSLRTDVPSFAQSRRLFVNKMHRSDCEFLALSGRSPYFCRIWRRVLNLMADHFVDTIHMVCHSLRCRENGGGLKSTYVLPCTSPHSDGCKRSSSKWKYTA